MAENRFNGLSKNGLEERLNQSSENIFSKPNKEDKKQNEIKKDISKIANSKENFDSKEKTQVTIRTTKELARKMKIYAAQNNMSVSALISEFIEELEI